MPRMDQVELASAIGGLSGGRQGRHVVVQLDRPLEPVERAQLERAGLTLLAYLGNQAFFASFSKAGVAADELSGMPFLSGVYSIEPRWKLDPRMAAGEVPDWAVVKTDPKRGRTVGVYVLFHPDIPLLTEGTSIARRHEGEVRSDLESVNGLVLELPLANLRALAAEDAVQWIEWPLPRLSEINDSNRAITEADIVQATPYGLDGSGVSVLVYDGGYARASHMDFQGRLTVRDASGLSDHATHVSGTIGGAGVANSTYKGMAPGVTIESYGYEQEGGLLEGFLYSDPGDLEADYDEAINSHGVHISNNSIGSNVESNYFDCNMQGKYGVTAALIDAIVGGSLGTPFRIVWANGNERGGSRCDIEGYGDYYSIAPPAGAKNHITVGALNSNDDSMTYFSSWGPTDDGRMKPDVSAPGCQSSVDYGVTSCSSASDASYSSKCGTSMASPTVCGLSALLLQDFRAQFPAETDPRNSTLKILLAHGAVDLGNTGPDYQHGYGSVRIQQSIDFMRTGNFLEADVDQGGTFSVLVLVDDGDPELKITMAWDDAPGTPNVDPALVNDLDLRVFDPSSQQHYPWSLDPANPGDPAVRTQANHVDNIEQVLVENPAPGVWRVDVFGYDVPQGPQPFSLGASPQLIACSSAGTVALDAQTYPCSDSAGVQVNDCDLNTSDDVIETITVTVDSTSEPGGETLLLTETAAESATFRGTIPLDMADSAGVLLVAHGDTVTATYIDADDGQGGQNVTVTGTAGVDCLPPLISNVQATDIEPFTATITFDTDEPASGTVRYGLSCAALTESKGAAGYKTAHAIDLAGLQETTTYFYAIDADDETGNAGTSDNGGACYSFTTPEVIDYFTEQFIDDHDLDNTTLTFTPDDSNEFYGGSTRTNTGLPVDPQGGTNLSFDSSDDGYALVSLSGGEMVSIYGTSYSSFYVGTNGYITFSTGDTDYSESLADHFGTARISALFDDLDPGMLGTVSWKQLADRAVVTWEDVTEYGQANANTFQIEMRFDGTIVISYTAIASIDGVAGLSEGLGLPDPFYETDLSAMGSGGEPSCDDGIQNQGEERIDCGGPCPPCSCLSDAECDDFLYCSGVESCDGWGECQAGTPLDCSDGVGCTEDTCIEDTDTCDHVAQDEWCDDDRWCNGPETCHPVAGCQRGDEPCQAGENCDELNDRCYPCLDRNESCVEDSECCSYKCRGTTGRKRCK